jgi:uncharacterized membrane protein
MRITMRKKKEQTKEKIWRSLLIMLQFLTLLIYFSFLSFRSAMFFEGFLSLLLFFQIYFKNRRKYFSLWDRENLCYGSENRKLQFHFSCLQSII